VVVIDGYKENNHKGEKGKEGKKSRILSFFALCTSAVKFRYYQFLGVTVYYVRCSN
jgi:hypothetical protein